MSDECLEQPGRRATRTRNGRGIDVRVSATQEQLPRLARSWRRIEHNRWRWAEDGHLLFGTTRKEQYVPIDHSREVAALIRSGRGDYSLSLCDPDPYN